MLIEQINKGDVLGARLSNGQEIVFTSISDNGHALVAEKVRLVLVQMAQGGEVSISLIPFVNGAVFDSEIAIFAHSLSTVPYKLSKDMEDFYIQNTSTIQVVQTPSIITK